MLSVVMYAVKTMLKDNAVKVAFVHKDAVVPHVELRQCSKFFLHSRGGTLIAVVAFQGDEKVDDMLERMVLLPR
jgi:hypothetical protein